MNNKVLIKLTVPELDKSFDVFIPVNEIIWKIKKMLIKCINDITNSNLDMNGQIELLKKEDGRVYNNNEIVIDTDIRNASELIIITNKSKLS